MATGAQNQAGANASGIAAYRLRSAQFARMIEAGVFADDERVELIGGRLFATMPKNQPHNVSVGELRDCVFRLLPEGWYVDDEKSVQVGPYDQPEPDLVVVRGARRDYLKRHPGPKDFAIVVEVSDTTYAFDHGVKLRRYAGNGIPAYWIVNINKRQVECYTDPAGRGRAASYATCVVYGDGGQVPLVLDGVEVGRILVKSILP